LIAFVLSVAGPIVAMILVRRQCMAVFFIYFVLWSAGMVLPVLVIFTTTLILAFHFYNAFNFSGSVNALFKAVLINSCCHPGLKGER
jgi:hypothetical protein